MAHQAGCSVVRRGTTPDRGRKVGRAEEAALHTISARIREAVRGDLDLCDSSCLDLPFRAEIRVLRQLADLS